MIPVYFRRYASAERLFDTPPHPGTHVIITIPTYRERHTGNTLRSLAACLAPDCHTEVLVLDNFPDNETAAPIRYEVADQPHLTFQCVRQALPARQAGVGLARKLLMDEAAWRLHELGREDGLIVGLDADCTVAPDYLRALASFQHSQKAAGASVYYEHPLSGNLDPRLYQAIAEYELHLRYFVHVRRWAGEWYAFQTVGSSMAVRSNSYQSAGGMNKRKAGEDFYFLQKIMPHGFTEIRNTCVYPSPRISSRVPFGTGKAMQDRLNAGTMRQTYAPTSFYLIREFYQQLDALYHSPTITIDPLFRNYLDSIHAWDEFERMRKISTDQDVFIKHLHHWMDGFRTMKGLHYLREHGHADVPVVEAAAWLTGLTDGPQEKDVNNLLHHFRRIDAGS